MKKSISYYVGTLLILLSFGVFTFIFYPVVMLYIFPVKAADVSHEAFSILIPKINASGKVIENVDPWNETEYRKALKEGIGHGKGFPTPDKKGAVYLFAHSSGLPWEVTHYNTVFLRLGELRANDEIDIWYKGKEYIYSVYGFKEVSPTDVKAVTEEKTADLILQTCTPLGTDWKRLLVYAKLKEVKE